MMKLSRNLQDRLQGAFETFVIALAVTVLAIAFHYAEVCLEKCGCDEHVVFTATYLAFAMYAADAIIITCGIIRLLREAINDVFMPGKPNPPKRDDEPKPGVPRSPGEAARGAAPEAKPVERAASPLKEPASSAQPRENGGRPDTQISSNNYRGTDVPLIDKENES